MWRGSVGGVIALMRRSVWSQSVWFSVGASGVTDDGVAVNCRCGVVFSML